MHFEVNVLSSQWSPRKTGTIWAQLFYALRTWRWRLQLYLSNCNYLLIHKLLFINNVFFSSFNNLAWIESKEEQVATWSFVIFDKNKNKMLERAEWKAFKDMVGGVKGLRKCGKKLPRYCDTNKDRQISMTEWLECLSVRQGKINYYSI